VDLGMGCGRRAAGMPGVMLMFGGRQTFATYCDRFSSKSATSR
jgi:hypothetical protein